MVMEWEAESDEAGTILGAELGDERGERLEASADDLIDAVGRARRSPVETANPTAVVVDEVIFEPSF
jgi:hypothetical protein